MRRARAFDADRRSALLGLAGLGLAIGGCTRSRGALSRSSNAWRELSFEPGEGAPEGERALVHAPPGAADLPLLVALHGRGESGRGLDVGARAWRDDYDLERLHDRLFAPPLVCADLQDLATAERLAQLNASLAAAPYRGLCVACPYAPDLSDRTVAGAQPFGRFVVGGLLPRVRTELGGRPDRAKTGIDGVSMGGRLALFVGLSHPEVFGSVGALQPALRADDAPVVSELARAAMARGEVKLRLASSDGDPFLPAIRAVSERLRADGVSHELVVVPGPHDYVWNRGPGGVEMLLWHERVLRGLPPP